MVETRNASPEFYGPEYYGSSATRGEVSGYPSYTRESSQSDVACYILWKYFDIAKVLDVGCAMGFLVDSLRGLGIEAKGVDFSFFAIQHCCAGAESHVFWGDITGGLPLQDGAVDLVSTFETLEHLPPGEVLRAIREIQRLARNYVVATIPSFGPNPFGPGGWFGGKVRPERIEHYVSLGSDYDGPVPYEDLARDTRGQPLEGHLTIASFRWWVRNFESAGLIPCVELMRRIQTDLKRFELEGRWNLYAFRTGTAQEPSQNLRPPLEIRRVERSLGLRRRFRRFRARQLATRVFGPAFPRLETFVRGQLKHAWIRKAVKRALARMGF